MRQIAINGRFLSQPVTGVQRYAFEVIAALDGMLAEGDLERPGAEVEILVPGSVPHAASFRFFKLRAVGLGAGQFWEQLSLPFFCRNKLLFTPSGGSPLAHKHHVFTIPDAGVFATPEAYASAYRAWYQFHHRRAVAHRNLLVLTVSQFSKKELQRELRINPERIAVTPLGHEHVLAPRADRAVLQRLGLDPNRYILGVGSANPNKNFQALKTAFQRVQASPAASDYKLAIVGGADARIFGQTTLVMDRIVQTGYLTDGELCSLYEHAACFVFPSFYEGFGLPPLEAMTLGCPVVCSNAASLPEVCGDAALMVDPHDSDAIASAILKLLCEPSARQELVDRGHRNQQRFLWKETAKLTWEGLLRMAQQ